MAGFTITDLKKHLGPGLGLRKNKYLIEIPVPGIEGRTLNILCRSAGLPERNITTKTLFHKGRRYNVRGETDYGGTYEVSILDDSSMSVRKVFDKWLKQVDNTKPSSQGILGGSGESGIGEILDTVKAGISVANQVKNAIKDPSIVGDFVLGLMDGNGGGNSASYQTDINIWQLSNDSKKVYGYKLQNAFPSQVGIVTLDDGDENTLSEFSVTFTFSEFTPLEDKSFLESAVGSILGDGAMEAYNGIESLFD